jgi:DNA-binding transcriptional LysR family regulator
VPETPAELADRTCIIDTNFRGRSNWPYFVNGAREMISVKGRVEVNSPAAVRLAGLRGLGIARTPYFLVRRDIIEGRVRPILEAYEPAALGIFAVYPHRRHLSGKVRAFVDFMATWFDERRAAGDTR